MAGKLIKRFALRFWPAIIITIVVFTFHSRLFLPEPSIYITPDYGRSDSWHLSIANKHYYAQELKKNRVPIWNPHIGTGFPTLAEGQTGIFSLPNLVLFRLLPFVLAYNLTLVGAFLTAAFGIFFFCRSLSLNKLTSTYAGLIFALGGFFMVHVQHHHLIQTVSIMPWLFWSSNEFLKTKKVLFLILLALFSSQQIFAGFPQLTFYSLVAILLFWSIKAFQQNLPKIKLAFIFTLVLINTFAISSIQLASTYELLKNSTRTSDSRNVLEQFPYKIKNLTMFLDPFILGSPEDATYPKWIPGEWGFYWESVAYVGIIPLSLAIALIIAYLIKGDKKNKYIFIFTFLAILSILLSLGKESPLRLIFSFPPFSIFRVPSRFLVITAFSITILTAIYLNRMAQKKFLIIIVITLSILDLYLKFANYNPITKAAEYFKEPETAVWLKNSNVARMFSIGQIEAWNDFFWSKGWQTTNYYFHARNSLDQNSNLIFNIDNLASYESLVEQRASLKMALIASSIKTAGDVVLINDRSSKLLAASNVSHIISPLEIEEQNFSKVFETQTVEDVSFKIFEAKTQHQRISLVTNYEIAKTPNKIMEIMSTQDFDPTKTAVLEKEPEFKNLNLETWTARIVDETPTHLKLNIENKGNGLLILNDSYYPGWKARIDGNEAEIFPVNINARAVYLKEGKHLVEILYQSRTIPIAASVSALAILFTIVILVKFSRTRII